MFQPRKHVHLAVGTDGFEPPQHYGHWVTASLPRQWMRPRRVGMHAPCGGIQPMSLAPVHVALASLTLETPKAAEVLTRAAFIPLPEIEWPPYLPTSGLAAIRLEVGRLVKQ